MPRFMYRTRRRKAAKGFVRLQRKFKKRRKQASINSKVYKLINAQKTFLDSYINILHQHQVLSKT